MAVQAQIKAVLESEPREDGTATLPIELDDIPGAVWQAELQSLMPGDMRVSLFERGGQKCALVTFSTEVAQALAAFEHALRGANEVSQQAYLTVANERRAREEAAAAKR